MLPQSVPSQSNTPAQIQFCLQSLLKHPLVDVHGISSMTTMAAPSPAHQRPSGWKSHIAQSTAASSTFRLRSATCSIAWYVLPQDLPLPTLAGFRKTVPQTPIDAVPGRKQCLHFHLLPSANPARHDPFSSPRHSVGLQQDPGIEIIHQRITMAL